MSLLHQSRRRIGQCLTNPIKRWYQSATHSGYDLEAAAIKEISGSGSTMEVFDRNVKRLHRDRAALLRGGADPLLEVITERLLDRVDDCTRKFPTAVILGGAGELVAQQLVKSRAGVEEILHLDMSAAMLDRAKASYNAARAAAKDGASWPTVRYIQADEEMLPLAAESVDLVVSSLGLHWANDLPGAMAQCRMALKPDGLFLAAMFGGETLQELRIACSLAQQEREGGISAFVSPLAQVRDAGNLLTRAGLSLPAVDVDSFQMRYPSAADLVEHLRTMAESNALSARRGVLQRDTALAAAALYQAMFAEGDGSVPASFQVMYMTGWAPHSSQPRPKQRGSATVSFEQLAAELEKQGAVTG